MPQPKATLQEMVDAVEIAASQARGTLINFKDRNPDRPPPPEMERRVFVLRAAVYVLAILATFEERALAFLNALRKEHGRG